VTIIVKAVPGLTTKELIEALGVPARQLSVENGGFAVDERTALRFLTAYVAAADQIAAPTPPPPAPVPAPVPAVAMTPVPPTATPARPPTARERAPRRKRG